MSGKQKIVLATGNKGKIAELAELLAPFEVDVLGLGDFPQIGEIVETGSTFAENALIKARAAAKESGLPAIADDSGLIVDALNGQPGVFSARYGDDWPLNPDETRDERNIRKLLDAMKDVPDEARSARFAAAMAAVLPDGSELAVGGEWRGKIMRAPVGRNGFGYDPVFFDPQLGRSAAQLEREEKNAVSHRARAAAALREAWPGFVGRWKAGKLEQ